MKSKILIQKLFIYFGGELEAVSKKAKDLIKSVKKISPFRLISLRIQQKKFQKENILFYLARSEQDLLIEE
jgi:hypothetical protein